MRGETGYQPARMETAVDFGARPAPALPESGVLISPGFSPAIGIPFLLFYGGMWCVFAYAAGYVAIYRIRRSRDTTTDVQRVA